MDRRIAILLVIIGILAAAIAYAALQPHDESDLDDANVTVNNTTAVNATLESAPQKTDIGQYGYCAICGKALSYSEAHNEYTQGKVCSDCASNPYYQTGEGADYANQKLKEAYPEDYEGMFEDSSDGDSEYDDGDD